MGDAKGKKQKAKAQKQDEARHAKADKQRHDKLFPQTNPSRGQPSVGR